MNKDRLNELLDSIIAVAVDAKKAVADDDGSELGDCLSAIEGDVSEALHECSSANK